MKELIQVDGGCNPVNGLKLQLVVCVVYNNQTLEILKTTDTHNKASGMANELYVDSKIDAAFDEVRFYEDGLNAINIVGRKLNEFQHFVDNYPNHPLCENVGSSKTL